MLRKLTFFVFSTLLLLSIEASSQPIVVTSGAAMTPAMMAAKLIDPSIVYSNVTEDCKPQSRGTFTGGTAIGIVEGVLLSTGRAKTAGSLKGVEGPNGDNCNQKFNDLDETMNGGNTNQNLRSMTSNTVFDQCILEFDFIADNTELSIEYVFASEEYDFYVGSQTYSDAFGFFISGPGISIPVGYTGKNIALIPGTSSFVSAYNLNKNTYPNLYVSNCDATKNACSYNGFTKILTAKTPLIVGETYHVALAIGDRGDGSMDSGVFIKANGISYVVSAEMVNFMQHLLNNKVELEWATTGEKNASHFEILKSIDGRNFTSIGKLKCVGNSSIQRTYSFVDKHPIEGTNYYRIKHFDNNGGYKYSPIIKQSFRTRISSAIISPNPVSNTIAKVQLELATALHLKAELLDLNSKVVYSHAFFAAEGSSNIELDLSAVVPGIYTLRLSDQENHLISNIQRLIK